jgi:integrase
LTTSEIVKFWKACDSVGEPFGSVFKLLLLTGARLREVAGMRRSELSDDGTWILPSSRSKNRRSHTVPLPLQARSIIAAVPNLGTDLLFTTTGTTAVSGWSKIKKRLDHLMGDDVPPWTLHDIRRSMVTHAAELGIAPHLLELIVNHVSGSKAGVAGTYNRSELLPERRAALTLWNSHVESIVAGGNVVTLRRA